MKFRRCVSCKIEKEATEEFFYKDKNRHLGLMYRCKECDRGRKDNRLWSDRVFTQEQIASKKKSSKKYSKTKKGKSIFILKAYEKADKLKGRECTITQEDIFNILGTPCTYCGFPATGFDRINNTIGHVKGNCVPCCKECNIARMDNFSHIEMFTIGESIRQVKLKRFT